MTVGSEEIYAETKDSLERIQQFDATSLARESELGSTLNFSEAIAPAQLLIDLYKRLSISALQDFPDSVLSSIRNYANDHYKVFNQILQFDVSSHQNPTSVRNTYIQNIINAYEPAFQGLHEYISYSLHRSADFQRLDSDARATLQSIEDKSEKISASLATHEKDAKTVLEEIRRVAAEEGVTKQAAHFNSEYEFHTNEAETWKSNAIKLAFALGVFAVLSLFLHKIPWLKPETTYDAIQLALSKFLIFFVMAYMLFLASKNFLNHKHNAIVNKHRQNALMTHTALVEASGDEGVRDAVLLQASSCIFSPQPTGYTSASNDDISNQKSVVEILSKPVAQAVREMSK
ncbi:hypothetical protein [Vibrio sp. SCSIO 43137]|uniref:hypothetical protein n=1 Tax=Vibrio sp. SCSIO 43137 TaxID=3021011 RepID=UPI00230744CE|nr:hypothetical protein [Vibrio sp. SCSIO 43137]WCE29977.1 hypothetical protein PK654_01300 [Vibrio sp. SCSIO 43137]